MELKLNFKEAPKLINERNQKSLFLFMQLPWLLIVVGTIASTSQGWVFIVLPKNVDDSFLGFIFNTIPNAGIYIIAVAVFNLVVDLLIFYLLLMMFKNKVEINKTKVIALLLIGHLLAISLYFISLISKNADAIAMSVMRLFVLASISYIFSRYLPRKYIEILVPYALVFTTLEIQVLRRIGNRSYDSHDVKKSKKKLGMYVRALLLALPGKSSEMDLINLLRKQSAIDRAETNERKKTIQDFCNCLHSSLKIQIPSAEIVFKEEGPSERRLRKIVSSMDSIFNLVFFTLARSSMVLDLMEQSVFPVAKNEPQIPTSYDEKSLRRLIRNHLDRAKKVDAISAKQKIYAFVLASFLSLVFPTVLYMIGLQEGHSLLISKYSSLILFIQYFATFMVALFTTNLMQKRYREAGIDVIVPSKLIGYFLNSMQFLFFFMIILSMDKTTYGIVISLLLKNMLLFFVGISIVQLAFLFMSFKPPIELKRSSVSSSLLVRELLLLRSKIAGARSLSNRKQVGRNIYFAKKYLKLIARNLTYSRFDAQIQKTHVREYFSSISTYLDNLGAEIKLGGEKSRVKGIDQIETLILFAAIEDFGEILDAIPEFRKHMEIKSIEPKRPSLIRQIFQFSDTSPTVRSIFVFLLFIIINLLFSSFWVDLQNISTLFQLMTP